MLRLLAIALLLTHAAALWAQAGAAAEPAPAAPRAAADPVSTYRLGTGDAVRIVLAGEEDMGAEQVLDERGEVRLPVVGPVRLAGLTLRAAEAEVERAFLEGRVLRRPQALVAVTTYRVREVTLTGQFGRVGRFAFPPAVEAMDLVDLVSSAGGLLETARASRTRVTRTDAAGIQQVFEVDLDALMEARREPGASSGFRVLPGDEIYVPPRFF